MDQSKLIEKMFSLGMLKLDLFPSDPPSGVAKKKPASSSSSKKKKPPPSSSSLRGTSSPECVVSSNKLLATSHDVSAVLEEGKKSSSSTSSTSSSSFIPVLNSSSTRPPPSVRSKSSSISTNVSPEKHACFDTCVENLNSSSLYPVTCPSCDSSLGTKKALYQHFNGGKCPNDFVPSSSFLSPYNLSFCPVDGCSTIITKSKAGLTAHITKMHGDLPTGVQFDFKNSSSFPSKSFRSNLFEFSDELFVSFCEHIFKTAPFLFQLRSPF
ncbi:hypothetical protein GEMRC1_011967 [Eukaryota sp. GEM-RC1]